MHARVNRPNALPTSPSRAESAADELLNDARYSPPVPPIVARISGSSVLTTGESLSPAKNPTSSPTDPNAIRYHRRSRRETKTSEASTLATVTLETSEIGGVVSVMAALAGQTARTPTGAANHPRGDPN